jgi:hypothetical protein
MRAGCPLPHRAEVMDRFRHLDTGQWAARGRACGRIEFADPPGAGGRFQGLQGIALSGWNADRLTDMGGRLALEPMGSRPLVSPRGAGKAVPVRGLW